MYAPLPWCLNYFSASEYEKQPVIGEGKEYYSPIDPNPAVATHAVFPQSGRSRLEKRLFFHIFPHFHQMRTLQKLFIAHRVPM